MRKEEFKYSIGEVIQDEKRNLTITEHIRKKGKRYKYHCNLCGFNCTENYRAGKYRSEHSMREYDLNNKNSCGCCSNKITVKGINDIATTHPHLVKYFANTEDAYTHTYASGERVLMKCPDCGFQKEMKINNLYIWGFSCDRCGDGIKYPNKFAFNLLEQLDIDFITEYSPEWVGKRAYDFYIPSLKLIIEMDGALGHGNKDNPMSGQTAEESKHIDNEKDRLANEHGIEVIRIDCDYGWRVENRFEHIKQNILNSRLNKIFDLSKIDFFKCDEFSCKNLIKMVCEYKRNNIELTTGDIFIILKEKYNVSTINRWLKLGNSFGWCYYNGEEEQLKSNRKNAEKNKETCSKSIICLDNGKTFYSVMECDRQSLNILGVKLDFRNISAVCNGKRNHTGGYHFKFIKDLSKEEMLKYNL